MTYAQQLEGDKHSERSKDNKKVRVELESYKLNDVALLWFTQLKENKGIDATSMT